MVVFFAVMLTDDHLLDLSERITSKDTLKHLGTNGLQLGEHQIDQVLQEYSTSGYNGRVFDSSRMPEAAHDVLDMWLKKQTSRETAFRELVRALQSCKMIELAWQLQEWVGIVDKGK